MNTHVPTTAGAVFLSYASQDAEAARRICDALRAAGLEVWFDQNELVGGDQWDAKIKRQIRECALFVPIISANTQARSEGYFRREWNLAAQRVLDMAPSRPFLLPIVIDDTSQRDALVAEEFLRVQWMRVPGGELSPAGVERTRTLLECLAHGTRDALPVAVRAPLPGQLARKISPRRSLLWFGIAGLAALLVTVGIYRGGATPPRTKQLAVLPFTSIGEAQGNQAFCEGLSETITSQLTQLEQFQRTLLVVPTSEIRKEAIVTASQARAMFGATLVLSGSVQRAEASVRVTVNLVDAVSLRIIRSSTFDSLSAELYRLQDRVAVQAAEWLGLAVSEQARKALSAGQTNVGSAYELYVKGRGELARRDGTESLNAAIVHLQQALIADPRYALAHAALGEAFFRKFTGTKDRRWIEEAQRSCRSALQEGGLLAAPHVTLATLLNGTGEYEQAAAEAETALRLDAANVDATRVLARAYDRLNRASEAEATYKRALERNPDNLLVLIELGTFYWRAGRMVESEKQFLRVAELTPQSYFIYRNLGGLYVMMGRPDQAAECLEKSLALKPSSGAYSNLGTLRFQQGRYADAASLYERASALIPQDYLMLGNLADALRFTPGRAAEATEVYARAIRLAEDTLLANPKDAAIHASLARYYAFTGNSRKALEAIAHARTLAPKNMPVIFNAALVYERLGERSRALEAVGAALQGGFSRIEISQAPDLKNLRADPRFVSLLNEPQQNK